MKNMYDKNSIDILEDVPFLGYNSIVYSSSSRCVILKRDVSLDEEMGKASCEYDSVYHLRASYSEDEEDDKEETIGEVDAILKIYRRRDDSGILELFVRHQDLTTFSGSALVDGGVFSATICYLENNRIAIV